MNFLHTHTTFSEMSIVFFGAAYKVWLLSCGSKQTSHSLFNVPFVRTHMHNLKSTLQMYMLCISNHCFTIEDICLVFWICTRDQIGKVRSHTCIVVILWCNIACVHTYSASISMIIGVSATLLQTPLLSRIIVFEINVAKQSRSASYGPVHTSLFGVQLHMAKN